MAAIYCSYQPNLKKIAVSPIHISQVCTFSHILGAGYRCSCTSQYSHVIYPSLVHKRIAGLCMSLKNLFDNILRSWRGLDVKFLNFAATWQKWTWSTFLPNYKLLFFGFEWVNSTCAHSLRKIEACFFKKKNLKPVILLLNYPHWLTIRLETCKRKLYNYPPRDMQKDTSYGEFLRGLNWISYQTW